MALVPLLTPLMVILLLVLILMPDAGPRDASLVFVLAVPLAPLLVGAAYDTVRRIVRVDLWLAGEQLVLRTQTQLRARERRIPLVDLKGARVVGTTVVLDVAGEAVEVPVPDRTPQTREELVAFLQVQIARSADRRGEVPDDLVRLRQATARVPERG